MTNATPHSARVAHHTRGRLRLQVIEAKGRPRILADIEKVVRQVPGVTNLRINASAGSVVIHYNPEHGSEFQNQVKAVGSESGVFQMLDVEIPDFDGTISTVKREAKFLAQQSRTAEKIVDSFARLNELVKRLTDNFVDLNVLLPLGLAALAFMGLGVDAGTPLWVTLAIFSFNSFMVLHSPWRIPNPEMASIAEGI
jgi:cation transport ATPase